MNDYDYNITTASYIQKHYEITKSYIQHYDKITKILEFTTIGEATFIFAINVFALHLLFSHQKIYKKVSNLILSGLLLSHATTAALNIVGYTIHHTVIDIQYQMKSRYIFFVTSMFSTTLVSMDKYISIRKPFYYQTIKLRSAVKANMLSVILSISIIGALLISPYMFGLILALSVTAGLMLCVTTVILQREVKKLNRVIKSTTVFISDADKTLRRNNKRQSRSLTVCTLIAISYVTLWTPFVTFTFYQLTQKEGDDELLNCIEFGLEMFAMLNSFLDPLFYIFINRDIKDAIKKKLYCFYRKASFKRPQLPS